MNKNKMKLKIDFEMLALAFDNTDINHHHFIDAQDNEIVFVNEWVESDALERLDAISENKGRYIAVPKRSSDDEFRLMETFVYLLMEESPDGPIDEFDKALRRPKPFHNFKKLLAQHPEIKEKWYRYKNNAIKNEVINWLVEKGIELENHELVPKIEIEEIKQVDIKDLPEEVSGFVPIACMTCKNEEGLEPRYFSINLPPENSLVEQETRKVMKEKYGISNYGNYTGGEKEILTAAKCPKCGSEDTFWDFKKV